VLVEVIDWDLWVYFADGRIDNAFADAYIASTRLLPNIWYDIEPDFKETRLVTAAKQEKIRFEIRTQDVFGHFATASAEVTVRSGNDMVLDRNVFEPETQSPLAINFKLSSNRMAHLEVFDVNGQRVTDLVEDHFNAGWNTYHWNGITKDGRRVGSGVYLITLRSGEFNSWKKVIIAR
jgi:hypothetical protein